MSARVVPTVAIVELPTGQYLVEQGGRQWRFNTFAEAVQHADKVRRKS